MLKLMYITNNTEIARIADQNGVDRIFIDLEVNGKEERQKGLNTVKSKHDILDVEKIKKVLKNAELLVRINPIYEKTKEEIDSVIQQGADIIMLPFFKTVKEVENFIKLVNKRCKTMLLVETPEAVENINEILKIDGIDEIHIGLNDLHLGYHMKFMFELLTDGTVEKLCNKFKNTGIINYGFGGIARVGEGILPAKNIIIEHYRLGSTIAILSRSFCNTEIIKDQEKIKKMFNVGVKEIRSIEAKASKYNKKQFEKNERMVEKIIDVIKRKG